MKKEVKELIATLTLLFFVILGINIYYTYELGAWRWIGFISFPILGMFFNNKIEFFKE